MTESSLLRHEAAGLHRFVRKIVAHASVSPSGRQARADGRRQFLRYVEQLGRATFGWLEQFAGEVSAAVPESEHRRALATVRADWQLLHRFAKPVADAGTLAIPLALVDALAARFAQLPGCADAVVVAFHMSDFDYLSLDTTAVGERLERLGARVGFNDPLPSRLLLIGVPYSQASGLYTNVLVAHQLGRYAAARTSAGSKISAVVESSLRGAGNSILHGHAAALVLQSWACEIFADYIAIWLAGAAYAWAWLEDMGDIDSLIETEAAPAPGFRESQPARLFRVQRHIEFLRQLGWWDNIAGTESPHARMLERIDGGAGPEPRADGTPHGELVRLMDSLRDSLCAIGPELTSGLASGAAGFREIYPEIREYLVRGVVPSTIVMEGGRALYPDPVTLINASYRFYLESAADLVGNIRGQDTSAGTRAKWVERLELWTLKAIEDHSLLERQQT